MCYCKFPPFTTLLAYLLLSILITSYYFYKAAGVDSDSGLISIRSCPAPASESFLMNLSVKRSNGLIEVVTGNVSLPFDIDTDVKVALEAFANEKRKTLIKRRSLCKIIENYMTEGEICPVPAGSYKIGSLEVGIDLPEELLAWKEFRMEILKADTVMACKIFRVGEPHVGYV